MPGIWRGFPCMHQIYCFNIIYNKTKTFGEKNVNIEPLQKEKSMSKTLYHSEKYIFTIAGIINKFYLKKKLSVST